MKKKKRLIFVEGRIPCPNCHNFLLEKVRVPAEFCRESREDDALLFGKRLGYYCPECRSHFSINLYDPS